MNKGGAGRGGGGGGPTAAAALAAAQKQKTLQQRVDNDIGNIVSNFSFIVNVARVNDPPPPVRNSHEAFMMEMRASKMVQSANSLLELVSELKQTTIYSGFPTLNDHVEQRTEELNQLADKTDGMLARIGEDAAASLTELESHYYLSALETNQIATRK